SSLLTCASRRERARILLRLLAGVAHQHVPAAMRAASAVGRRGVEPGKRFLRGAERDFLLAAFLPDRAAVDRAGRTARSGTAESWRAPPRPRSCSSAR